MKNAKLAVIAFSMICSFGSQAQESLRNEHDGYRTRRGNGGVPGFDYPAPVDPPVRDPNDPCRLKSKRYTKECQFAPITGSRETCSPEVKAKNVSVVERTLDSLVKTKDFAKATVLATTLKEIHTHKNIDDRIQAYASLVGVDARDARQMAEFVGARDLAPYAAFAGRKLHLSERQSGILVSTLSEKLLNSLND